MPKRRRSEITIKPLDSTWWYIDQLALRNKITAAEQAVIMLEQAVQARLCMNQSRQERVWKKGEEKTKFTEFHCINADTTGNIL